MTQRGFVTEILNVHADRLKEGRARPSREYLRMFPDQTASLEPLMDLAERVHGQLQPVRPRAAFRRRLRQELLLAMASSYARPRFPFWVERRTTVSMAAGGAALAVTVAGLAAWLLRHRLPLTG